ncbi:hypothetical protein AB2063_001134 [Clostridium botulinum]
MAGNAKPNIPNLGDEGKIKFLEYNDQGRFDKIETLINGDTNKHSEYGILLYSTSPMITFEVYQNSNIYAYGNFYSDGGGYTPMPVDLYIKNNEKYELLKEGIKTKYNEWYLLFENLKRGIYQIKCMSRYASFAEWYIENLDNNKKYLINQNKNYYSTKSNFFNLGRATDNTQLENWYNKYGADDVNIITENLNNKEFPMSKDENGIWKTDFELDMNEVIDNIELVDTDENNKFIKYNCNDYRILDLCDDQFKLTMCKTK